MKKIILAAVLSISLIGSLSSFCHFRHQSVCCFRGNERATKPQDGRGNNNGRHFNKNNKECQNPDKGPGYGKGQGRGQGKCRS